MKPGFFREEMKHWTHILFQQLSFKKLWDKNTKCLKK